MSLVNAIEQEVLDHLFGYDAGINQYTPPGTYYLALSTSAINDDGTGMSEPGDANYARQPIANDSIEFVAASSPGGVGTKTNANDISWLAAATGFGTLTHWALMDALSGGNMIVFGTMNPTVVINASDVLTIKAGALKITCD
jgi:hypothetical protein